MKPLVIYHANCADGFGAAFTAWLKLGDEAEYVACQYGEADKWPGNYEGREVYILDFSFPRPIMDDIFANAKRVVWLDHHKTAFEMWTGGFRKGDRWTAIPQGGADPLKHYVVLDDNFSGAMLAWEYFHPDVETPALIQHIDDYDRWQFKIAGTKEFNKALWSYAPWSFEQWRGWLKQYSSWGSFISDGAAILRAHNQNVQSVMKGAARKVLIYDEGEREGDGGAYGPGLAANCPPHLTSDVGHELAVQSGTFGLCWTLNQTKPVANCSLRSNGDYDVSAIAKAFGGGGHRNAAGFEVPIDTLLGWMT